MPENKEDISNQLAEALKRTRMWDDITRLKYIKEDSGSEYVYVDYKGKPAARRINVTCDSGWQLIKDVIKALSHDGD